MTSARKLSALFTTPPPCIAGRTVILSARPTYMIARKSMRLTPKMLNHSLLAFLLLGGFYATPALAEMSRYLKIIEGHVSELETDLSKTELSDEKAVRRLQNRIKLNRNRLQRASDQDWEDAQYLTTQLFQIESNLDHCLSQKQSGFCTPDRVTNSSNLSARAQASSQRRLPAAEQAASIAPEIAKMVQEESAALAKSRISSTKVDADRPKPAAQDELAAKRVDQALHLLARKLYNSNLAQPQTVKNLTEQIGNIDRHIQSIAGGDAAKMARQKSALGQIQFLLDQCLELKLASLCSVKAVAVMRNRKGLPALDPSMVSQFSAVPALPKMDLAIVESHAPQPTDQPVTQPTAQQLVSDGENAPAVAGPLPTPPRRPEITVDQTGSEAENIAAAVQPMVPQFEERLSKAEVLKEVERLWKKQDENPLPEPLLSPKTAGLSDADLDIATGHWVQAISASYERMEDDMAELEILRAKAPGDMDMSELTRLEAHLSQTREPSLNYVLLQSLKSYDAEIDSALKSAAEVVELDTSDTDDQTKLKVESEWFQQTHDVLSHGLASAHRARLVEEGLGGEPTRDRANEETALKEALQLLKSKQELSTAE